MSVLLCSVIGMSFYAAELWQCMTSPMLPFPLQVYGAAQGSGASSGSPAAGDWGGGIRG